MYVFYLDDNEKKSDYFFDIRINSIDYSPGSYLSGGKILPTNAMNYKDKYILFYLEGKKALSEKRVSRILGISSPDDMPDGYHGQDPRIWVYIKDK